MIVLAAVLLGAAVLLAAGELRLRARYPRRAFDVHLASRLAIRHLKLTDDPDLVYEPTGAINPLTSDIAAGPEDAEVNAFGFRDRYWPTPRARGGILVLGDSIARGKDVPLEKTFPRVLEDRLRRAGRPAVVYNAGVNGYGVRQESALFERRLGWLDPAVVVLAYALNDRADFDEAVAEGGTWRVAQRNACAATLFDNPLDRWLRRRSVLYTLALRQSVFWLGRRGLAAGRIRFEDDDGGYALSFLDAIARRCAERGRAFLVAVFPVLSAPPGTEAYFVRERAAVLDHCRAKDIPVLDLAETFRAAGHDDLRALRAQPGEHTHPGVEGHRLAAEALAERLLREIPSW